MKQFLLHWKRSHFLGSRIFIPKSNFSLSSEYSSLTNSFYHALNKHGKYIFTGTMACYCRTQLKVWLISSMISHSCCWTGKCTISRWLYGGSKFKARTVLQKLFKTAAEILADPELEHDTLKFIYCYNLQRLVPNISNRTHLKSWVLCILPQF